MWLLNAETQQLEHFMDDRQVLGQYAILSHTWGNDEVSFDDMASAVSRTKKGFSKVDYACRQALSNSLNYVWLDTCCIDKRSSAELSQAINSMYRWYYNASVCYVYLSDLTLEDQSILSQASQLMLMLKQCRWFTRGWTLQELIAPKTAYFFDTTWNFIASRTEIASILADITNIDQGILTDRDRLQHASVAKRMSWASNRATTLVEDQAYSLLGLFDINMSLLYGEGLKAFKRLQEEILRTWSQVDHSILAWDGRSDGLLAMSPAQFPVYFSAAQSFGNIQDEFPVKRDIISWSLHQNEIFELSNKGLRISLYACSADVHAGNRINASSCSLHQKQDTADTERLIVALNCSYSCRRDELFALYLSRRPWIDSSEHQSRNIIQQDYAIYDFEPQYTTVKASELRNFTMVTLTIARMPYQAPPSDVEIRILWEACRYSVKRTYPEWAWVTQNSELVLDPWKLSEIAGGSIYLIKDKQNDERVVETILNLDVAKFGRLRLPKLYMQAQKAGLSYTTREIKCGERRILEVEGEAILDISGRYLLVGGRIIWYLCIRDPLLDGESLDF